MTEQEALKWVFGVADEEFLKPWQAWSELHEQITAYHCWGCDGEFISKWPQWEEPTDETFPHGEQCSYVSAKKLSVGA